MSNAKDLTYENIDRPYDYNLERSVQGGVATAFAGSSGAGEEPVISSPFQIDSGTVEGKSFSDVWISNFIKSKNYKPKTIGFFIDGKEGFIECMSLLVGSGGIIGGKLDIPDTTTVNSFHVDSDGNAWWGANTASGYAGGKAYVSNAGIGYFEDILLSTSASGTRTVVSNVTNDIRFFVGSEASPRIFIGTSDGHTAHIGIANPASSAKDGLYIDNKSLTAVTVLNSNTAASYAIYIDHDGVKDGVYYEGSANLNLTAGQEAHWYLVKTGTGAGRLMYLRNEGTGVNTYIENNIGTVGSTTALEIQHYGTGNAILIDAGDVNLGGNRLINLKTKDGAPSSAELGAYGLIYDVTNERLYFNNNGTPRYAQFV